jgi:type III secretion protein J
MACPAGPRPSYALRVARCACLALVALAGCKVELQHGLDEEQANEMVSALEGHGVAAEKEPQGRGEGWLVSVPSGEATRAWQVLRASGLPRRPVRGFEEVFGDPGLIPSPLEEQARLQEALAGDLERSLMAMDGVLDAHVHLVVPTQEPLAPSRGPLPVAGAAVLLVYAAEGSGRVGPDVDAVRRLVAGAVAGLSPDAVEVVTTPRATGAEVPALEWVQVGPIQVSRASVGALQAVLAGLGALVLVLSGLLVVLLWRRRRATAPGS